MKIALLSSYTIDLIADVVRAELARSGLDVELYLAPFGQYQQEVLDSGSGLSRFAPEYVAALFDADVFLADTDALLRWVETTSQRFPQAHILVHLPIATADTPLAFLEWNQPESRDRVLAAARIRLAELCGRLPNARLVDPDRVIRRHGTVTLFDPRLWYLAKIPFSSQGSRLLGEQLAKAVLAVSGRRMKCLVLDLDNTLWGGVLGEDGLDGIKLSNDGEGKAFYDLQRGILKLHESGVVLAVCSKNDPGPAVEAIEKHPYMLLRQAHFAAMRINWSGKPENIASIAGELSLGLDSFVYLDDSPQERALVRQTLPAVAVPDLPADFSDYPRFLADLPYFETFTVTPEDRARGASYYQERRRSEAKAEIGSIDDYLRSLGTRIHVRRADSFTIPRIAQLTQRTNQFNLTTRRYTEAEVRDLAADRNNLVLCMSAEDRFGETGIVGVAIVRRQAQTAVLDTFLVSCRVLGRQIEEAFLTATLVIAKQAGHLEMIGEYVVSSKNAVAKGFLVRCGFAPKDTRYGFDLARLAREPKHVTVEYDAVID